MSSCTTTLTKQDGERIQFGMDFSNRMSTGDTIDSQAVTSLKIDGSASDLTIETPTVSEQVVYFWISGGTAGLRYKITVTITTSTTAILEGDGQLSVYD